MDFAEPSHRGAAPGTGAGRTAGQLPISPPAESRTGQWQPATGGSRAQTAADHQPARDLADGPQSNRDVGVAGGASTDGANQTPSTPKAIPRDFPPVVYLPCAEAVDDPNDARIDMRQTRDGKTALLAYSALDRLQDCCGKDQAWIVAPTAVLSRLQDLHPFQLLMLDIEIPIEQRRGQA